MWSFVYAAIYNITTVSDYFFHPCKNKIQQIVVAILAVLSAIVYFAAAGISQSVAMLLSFVIFRVAFLVVQIAEKKPVQGITRTVSMAGFDFATAIIAGSGFDMMYLLIAYGFVYCVLSLIPCRILRQQTIDRTADFEGKNRLIVIVIPVVSLICSGVCFVIFLVSTELNGLLTGVLCVLICAGMIIIQELLSRYFYLSELNFAMTQWQNGAKEYMNTIRSQRHDFNLHLHAISGLIAAENYPECQSYVQKLVQEANAVNELMPIYDAVIGSMMSDMRTKAMQKGIKLTYDIKYDMKDILCNAYECNRIIGNLIQNAIDVVNTEAEKAYGIQVSVLKKRGNTVIIVENLSEHGADGLEKIFNLGYTTKTGHEGLGLPMIEKTVKRYGGNIYVNCDGNIIRFYVHIPNKITLNE